MDDKGYRRLWWKIVATTLGFSLIPLFTVGLAIYNQAFVAYKDKTMEGLRTMAENRRDAIDLFLDERIAQLYTLANTSSFENLSKEGELDRVFTLMQVRSKSFVDLGVIDEEGSHVAYSGPYKLRGLNYKNEEWFHLTMLRGVYVSDIFTGFRKLPHFIIAVMKREGEHNWMLRATIDTGIFDGLVKAAQAGDKGDAFVVNAENVFQTTPRFGGNLLDTATLPSFTRFPGTRIQNMEINGKDSLVALTWLKNKEWLLVIKEDPKEELLPVTKVRLLAIMLVIGGILVIIGGAVFVTKSMIGQLIEADRQKALLDANLVQSSKMAALGKLAAGIAHEVNNPLAVIKEKVGWLRDLLSEEDITKSENYKEFEDAVRKIDIHVDRAKKVTHRLLGFARRMEPIQEKVDINKLLDETIDFLRNEAHYRNITINTEYSSDLPPVVSDTAQLQQVFLNLINNAIDAIGKDGEIQVVTSANPQEGRDVVVTIHDSGPGIPTEVLNRIFDPFFTTKEVGKGTGLGLSISYSIIEKLGGRLLVASQEGQGATFTIYLPKQSTRE
ncbi:MAG: ATP-binding protein [Syntrophobacteraceae bacterium]